MRKTEGYYFRYFEKILSQGGIAADITPAYAALSADRMTYVRQGMTSLGIDTKCVFLMRDPVDRCLSAFTMNRVKAQDRGTKEGVPPDGDASEAFEEYIESEHCRIRTSYEITLRNIEASFDCEMRRVMFYETLFEPNSVREISDFLGVRYRPEMAARRVNSAKTSYEIDDKLLTKCAGLYRETYEQVADRFPVATDIWGGYARIV